MELNDKAIVFLDVDGILTYSGYKNKETDDIDIEKVKILKDICDESNADVVIISSWRGTADWTPPCYNTLIRVLANAGVNVIGDAPYISVKFVNSKESNRYTFADLENTKIEHGTGRAAEVEKYLSEHPVKRFVILDDEDHDWADYGYENNWVSPSWFINGLEEKHKIEALKVLKKT